MIRTLILAATVGLVVTPISAQVIDFETTPGGSVPTDDLVLPSASTYMFGPLSISFGFDYDTNGVIDADAVFEHMGLDPSEPPNGGFAGSNGTDTADVGFGAQLGDFFLRSPVPGSDFGRFIITYSGGPGVTSASGEIWDIDGTFEPGGSQGDTEEYTVRAYDAGNNLIGTQVSPLGVLQTPFAPLDGRPWVFNFTSLSAPIARIEVDFTGSKPAGIGLAFNNFYPTQSLVPEPGTSALAALAGLSVIAYRRRQG